nr:hypothetical protein [Tanacetum cinerariifolium]
MEESLRKFMEESAKRHKENSNLIKEIQASMNVAIRNQRASIKALEIQIGKMSKEGEVIDELMMDIVKTRCDDEFLKRLDEYPSYCDFDRKIHIDCTYNLQFACMIDFVVIENMDAYHDEGMGDIFVGKPFVEKHVSEKGDLTNVQCNKMRPLVKVSTHDELKGILHQYQKLKGFYKGFSNLGSEYIKNEKVEEWLTCGHVSIHEME